MSKLLKYLALAVMSVILIGLFTLSPLQAAGALNIDGTPAGGSGTVDSTHTITGTGGFIAGESITVYWDGSTVLPTNPALTAIVNTGFSASFTIPSSPSGVIHSITAVGSTSGTSSVVNFNVLPKIIVSANSALIATSITVTGSGYLNAETNIVTTFDGSTVVGTSQTASALGAWTNTFNVPSLTPGSHTIHSIGSGAVDSTVTFTVVAPPKITLSLARATVGSQVTITGSAFAPNESGITATLANNQVGSTTSANASGAWTLQFTVPETPGGIYPVAASGSSTQAGAAPNVNFTVAPSIDINPQAGPAGTSVTVSGTGFASSESNIAPTLDGSDQGSTVKADAAGSWTATFTLPVTSGGAHNIGAHGQRTLAASISPIAFRVGSGISINKNSGPTGTSITVSGNGFAVSETNITVSFDSAQVATATANASGNWTASVVVPVAAGGDHTITARGRTTVVSSGSTFTITPTISIDKSAGTSGASLIITGNGFAASETGIALTFDGARVGQPVTANATGAWTSTFQVPPSSSGTHLIGVNGSVTQLVSSANLSFKVSATLFLSQSGGFPGSQLVVNGSGFAAGSTLQITFDDNPISNVGAINSDQSGNFSKTITVPKSTAGSHTIKVIDAQSNTDSKTYTIDSTPPAAPRPNSPPDASKAGFFGGITPTFKWAAVTDSRGDAYLKGVTYDLQIDTSSDFSNPVVDLTGLTKTSVTLSGSEALPGGQYFWHVRAVDAASNAGDWSVPFTLTSGVISAGLFALILIAVIAVLIAVYFVWIRRWQAGRRLQPVPEAAPEIVIPEIVNAEYRITEGEDSSRRKALPWRLSLPAAPAAPKGQKTISAEDQARLKTIVDFARSLPLVEPGPNTAWLVDLAENGSGVTASPALYSQLLKGEIQVKYEPAWMRHPTYLDLENLLEGQPVMADLNGYIDSLDRSAAEAVFLLQDIYRDINSEVSSDILANGGWAYISAVYTDAFNWFRGKYLREPSERDYSIKPAVEGKADSFALNGEDSTPFGGRLITAPNEEEAAKMRSLHLKLRRSYRNNERARELAGMLSQLEIQRTRLLNAFSQMNRLGA